MKVKKLKWKPLARDGRDLFAECDAGTFIVTDGEASLHADDENYGEVEVWSKSTNTLREAKAAAQAHFEQQVERCLDE